jgi:hypothetical protein
MKKEYGWVDYSNLAINVVQVAHLQAARAQIAQLEQSQLDDRIRSQIQNQLRQRVFELEETLKAIVGQMDRRPIAVHLLCWMLKDCFTKTGISPAAFEAFGDKDRVKKVLDEIGEAIKSSYDRLDQQSRREADECYRFIGERGQLEDLIALLKQMPPLPQMELQKCETELNEKQIVLNRIGKTFRSTERRSDQRFTAIKTFGLGGMLLAIIPALMLDVDRPIAEGLELLVITLLLFPGAMFVAIFWGRAQDKKDEEELKRQSPEMSREQFHDLDLRCATLKARCREIAVNIEAVEMSRPQFGSLTEQTARELQKERECRIEQAMSLSEEAGG